MNITILLIVGIAFLLITAVLIQNPKGGGVDSTYGGAKVDRAFGVSKSTNFVENFTWGLAFALFLTCIVVAVFI